MGSNINFPGSSSKIINVDTESVIRITAFFIFYFKVIRIAARNFEPLRYFFSFVIIITTTGIMQWIYQLYQWRLVTEDLYPEVCK